MPLYSGIETWEEALAAVSWARRAELGECGRTRALAPMKKTGYFIFSEEKALTPLLPTQWNTSLSPRNPLFAFFPQKAENWRWSFCCPGCPATTTGSSNCEHEPHKHSAIQTCRTSQSCGARDHRKNRPLRHGERGEVADVIPQPSPALGEQRIVFPWMTVDVPVQQCLCRQMFGIPQGIFDPCPANPDGYASAWSICTARCQIND